MTTTLNYQQMGTLVRSQTHALFPQTMGYVAATAAFFALGAYLGRNLTGGVGIFFFLVAFACLIGMRFAARRSSQLTVGLLLAFGLRVHHVRLPAPAHQYRRHHGAVPGRVDFPRRAERVPVLPGDLLRRPGSGAMSAIDDILAGFEALRPSQEAFCEDLHCHPELSHDEHRTARQIPDAVGAPYCYRGLGFTDRKTYLAAEKDGRLEDLPVNHSPKFLPPLEPTLRTGTEALVTAALAWLAP
jgi:hypothetical protein